MSINLPIKSKQKQIHSGNKIPGSMPYELHYTEKDDFGCVTPASEESLRFVVDWQLHNHKFNVIDCTQSTKDNLSGIF